MGVDVDLNPGEPIVAPGKSRVLGIQQGWYAGQPYVGLQLLDGPLKGRNYYVAEQIDPAVTPGQIVEQGQPIAHYASHGTGIEIGWAGQDWAKTLAQEQGNTGDASHNDSPAGIEFHNFLTSLPHHSPLPEATPSTNVASGAAAAAPAGHATVDAAHVAEPASANPSAPAAKPLFEAAEPHRRSLNRDSVHFMPAIEPRQGSPVAAQAAQDLPAGPTAAGATPANAPLEIIGPATGGHSGAAAALQQAGAVASGPTGGTISVFSSYLTRGQQKFAGHLSELTGLDARVISAWELAEESGNAARAREAARNFNWLNIGYFDSGPGAIASDKAFSDPVTAAEQTARFLKGTWGGASAGIRAILGTVGQNAQVQMSTIANSGWASSHYGGGADLRATYDELADIEVSKT
jgi:hypothetical protein